MSNVKIRIAEDFSDAPGARYKKDGPDSGELFYDVLLKEKFEQALSEHSKLVVDMDRTYGYATSFLSEAFGKLSENYGPETVLSVLEIISHEDESVRDYTLEIIKNPNKK